MTLIFFGIHFVLREVSSSMCVFFYFVFKEEEEKLKIFYLLLFVLSILIFMYMYSVYLFFTYIHATNDCSTLSQLLAGARVGRLLSRWYFFDSLFHEM